MWIILTDQNHNNRPSSSLYLDFRTQKHQSSSNNEAGVSVHSDREAVHAGLLGQQSGVVVEDGAADVDGVSVSKMFGSRAYERSRSDPTARNDDESNIFPRLLK